MAYYNKIFYSDFLDDFGNKYRLELRPGYHTDYSSPTSVKMPVDVMLDDVELDRSLPDDLPFGLELAPSMKLKIDLSRLTTAWDADASDLQAAIIRGQSATARAYVPSTGLSTDVYIPNRWRLLEDTLLNNSYSKVRYDGLQNFTPGNKYKFKPGDSEFIYEINCTGILHSALLIVNYLYLRDVVTDENSQYLRDLYYVDSGTVYLHYNKSNTSVYNLIKMSTYNTELQSKIQDIYRYFTRDSSTFTFNNDVFTLNAWTFTTGSTTLTTTSNTQSLQVGMIVHSGAFPDTYFSGQVITEIVDSNTIVISAVPDANGTAINLNFHLSSSNTLSHITFYEQNYLKNAAVGDQILNNNNELYLTVEKREIIDGVGQSWGGLLYKDTTTSLGEYNSFQDIISEDAFAKGCKVIYNLNPLTYLSAPSTSLNHLRLFDNVKKSYIDSDGSLLSSITDDDIYTQIEMEQPYKYTTEAISHYKDAHDNDINEFVAKNRGNQSGDSIALNHVFQNSMTTIQNNDDILSDDPGYRIRKETTIYRNLHYKDTYLYKIHHINKIDFGLNDIYTGVDGNGDLSTHTSANWYRRNYNKSVSARGNTGLGYYCAAAISKKLNKPSQVLLKFEVLKEKYDIDDIGERINITLSDCLPSGVQLPSSFWDTKGIIVNCKMKVRSGMNEIKLFVGGV